MWTTQTASRCKKHHPTPIQPGPLIPPLGIYFRNDGKSMKSIQLGMFFFIQTVPFHFLFHCRSEAKGRVRNFSRGGLHSFLFQGGAQDPLGPENLLKSIDFTGHIRLLTTPLVGFMSTAVNQALLALNGGLLKITHTVP